jgi:ATP-dependent Clp protease ATP-binding subunit ClpB
VADREAVKSLVRVLNKRIAKLPRVEPAPEQLTTSADLRKALQHASKLQKKRGDAYMGVDLLLLGILEQKDVGAALEEAGLNKSQLAGALEEVRGATGAVNSSTGQLLR